MKNGHGKYVWDKGTFCECEFKDDFPNGKAELEQLKRDIAQMKANAATDTIRNYLQMAIAELDKIK